MGENSSKQIYSFLLRGMLSCPATFRKMTSYLKWEHIFVKEQMAPRTHKNTISGLYISSLVCLLDSLLVLGDLLARWVLEVLVGCSVERENKGKLREAHTAIELCLKKERKKMTALVTTML